MRGWRRADPPEPETATDAAVHDRFVRVIGLTPEAATGEVASVFAAARPPAGGAGGCGGVDVVGGVDLVGGVGASGASGAVGGAGAADGGLIVVEGGTGPDDEAAEGQPTDGGDAAGGGAGASHRRPGSPPASCRALAAFDPGRRGVRAIAVVAVVVAIIAGLVAWQSRPRPQPVPPRAETAAATQPGASDAASPTSIVVSVAGKVRRPGLVRLPAGARVADAIEAAGGLQPDTDVAYLNLARRLTDGELVLVGVAPSAGADATGGVGATAPAATASGGKVNLNTAGLTELQTLPGIGPVLAQRILDYRTRHGRFSSPADLRKVEGIGSSRFEQLKDLVAV